MFPYLTCFPVCPPDSKAIVDGNLKLILGLIWTLILHYSISMPMWEDEDDEDAKKLTPKQRLLGWIQNKVPQLPITNFHRDWRDGKALGALVDNCAPGRYTMKTLMSPEGNLFWTQNCGQTAVFILAIIKEKQNINNVGHTTKLSTL